jgi:hypothetical protein
MKFSAVCAAAAAGTAAAQQIVVPTVTLANGVKMPVMAAGVGGDNDTDATSSILTALSLGILSVDAAQDYMNLAGVAEALRLTQVPRSDIFLTTKVPGCGVPTQVRQIQKSPPPPPLASAAHRVSWRLHHRRGGMAVFHQFILLCVPNHRHARVCVGNWCCCAGAQAPVLREHVRGGGRGHRDAWCPVRSSVCFLRQRTQLVTAGRQQSQQHWVPHLCVRVCSPRAHVLSCSLLSPW